jgi:hypothetical protein
VELELPTLPVHPVLSVSPFTRSLVLCACFVNRCLSYVLFPLVILFSVLRFTAFDYHFGIFFGLPRLTASDYPLGIFILLIIVLSALPRLTSSGYPLGIFILLTIVLSALPRLTISDYPFDIFKLLTIIFVCPSSIYGF